jgi:transposase
MTGRMTASIASEAWREGRSREPVQAFIPLRFDPGEAYQFDWSHEAIEFAGVPLTVKVAQMRLAHSRMPFVRAYFRETQEMVFDAHDRAFAFYSGACRRGIYDNMRTAVETVFVGRARAYNRRFLQLCSHHLVELVACTPAGGWEKGQVENQAGTIRDLLFRPSNGKVIGPDLLWHAEEALLAGPERGARFSLG